MLPRLARSRPTRSAGAAAVEGARVHGPWYGPDVIVDFRMLLDFPGRS